MKPSHNLFSPDQAISLEMADILSKMITDLPHLLDETTQKKMRDHPKAYTLYKTIQKMHQLHLFSGAFAQEYLDAIVNTRVLNEGISQAITQLKSILSESLTTYFIFNIMLSHSDPMAVVRAVAQLRTPPLCHVESIQQHFELILTAPHPDELTKYFQISIQKRYFNWEVDKKIINKPEEMRQDILKLLEGRDPLSINALEVVLDHTQPEAALLAVQTIYTRSTKHAPIKDRLDATAYQILKHSSVPLEWVNAAFYLHNTKLWSHEYLAEINTPTPLNTAKALAKLHSEGVLTERADTEFRTHKHRQPIEHAEALVLLLNNRSAFCHLDRAMIATLLMAVGENDEPFELAKVIMELMRENLLNDFRIFNFLKDKRNCFFVANSLIKLGKWFVNEQNGLLLIQYLESAGDAYAPSLALINTLTMIREADERQSLFEKIIAHPDKDNLSFIVLTYQNALALSKHRLATIVGLHDLTWLSAAIKKLNKEWMQAGTAAKLISAANLMSASEVLKKFWCSQVPIQRAHIEHLFTICLSSEPFSIKLERLNGFASNMMMDDPQYTSFETRQEQTVIFPGP